MKEFLKEIKGLNKEIKKLKTENDETSALLTSKKDAFKTFLNERFKNVQIASDAVQIKDDVNTYLYEMKKETLKLTKKEILNGWNDFDDIRDRGFYHPMYEMEHMLMRFMKTHELNTEEVIYENGNKPKEKEKTNIFEELKEDMLNNGIVSQTIKNYISVDLEFRKGLETIITDNNYAISRMKNDKSQKIRNYFSKDKLEEMFSNNTVLSVEDGYKFKKNINPEVPVVSISLNEVTKNKYHITILFENGEKENLSIEKNYFNVDNYLVL